jgi:hypothetical protein
VAGPRITLLDRGGVALTLQWSAAALEVAGSGAAYAGWRGQRFVRCG